MGGGIGSGSDMDEEWNEIDVGSESPTSQFTFCESAGPQVSLSTDAEPVQFFQHFFDSNVLALIVEETNR